MSDKSKILQEVEKYKIPYEELKFEGSIGQGGQGTVYKGKYLDKPVALKRIQKNSDVQLGEALFLLNHPHERILRCYGWAEDENFFYLVTDLLKANLSDILYGANKLELSSQDKLKVALQIAEGLYFLRSIDVCHRDIKSS